MAVSREPQGTAKTMEGKNSRAINCFYDLSCALFDFCSAIGNTIAAVEGYSEHEILEGNVHHLLIEIVYDPAQVESIERCADCGTTENLAVIGQAKICGRCQTRHSSEGISF